jgi:hypothetical protein
MLVFGILLGASLLGFAGGSWWVVPIGACLLLLEKRDVNTAAHHGLSSLALELDSVLINRIPPGREQ